MSLTPAPKGYPIKLVRDNTPQILNGSGEPGALFYGDTPDGDRHDWLKKKLLEEVGEYLVDGGWAELRDVLAVVDALACFHGTGLLDLMRALDDDPRGGFHRAVMMFGHHPEFDGSGEADHS